MKEKIGKTCRKGAEVGRDVGTITSIATVVLFIITVVLSKGADILLNDSEK